MKPRDHAVRTLCGGGGAPSSESRQSGVWLGCALLCALLGCTEKVAQTRQRGLAPGEESPRGPTDLPAPQALVEPKPRAPSSLSSPFASKSNPGSLMRTEQALPVGASAPPAPAGPPDSGVQRDLSAELVALLGQPAECLELAAVASSGGRLTITVNAYTVPSGRITRATVTAPGQPSGAVRCIEQRVMSKSLRGPVPGAPREVRATVPVEVISQPNPR